MSSPADRSRLGSKLVRLSLAALLAPACARAPEARGTGQPPSQVTGARVDARLAPLRLDGVATWRGDATAAYSLVHDDVCDKNALGVFTAADPELQRRGLHAGFGVIAGACDTRESGTWPQVRALVAHGHDVFSHSWDHPCMTRDGALAESCDPAAPRSTDFPKQIGQARDLLLARTGLAQQFFIFPYDVCDPAALAYLKENGYLWARCGGPGINMPDFVDPFAVNFDVFGPSYSRYFGVGPCAKTAKGAAPAQYTTTPADYSDECRLFVLNHYVDDAIRDHGWALRELHGLDPVDPAGWETVSLVDYRAHLDYLLTRIRDGALWVEGPSAVLRYRFARDARTCALPTLAGGTLRFPPPSDACRKTAAVLSYRLSTSDGSDPIVTTARQAGVTRPVRKTAPGHYVVDADPTQGDAVLAP